MKSWNSLYSKVVRSVLHYSVVSVCRRFQYSIHAFSITAFKLGQHISSTVLSTRMSFRKVWFATNHKPNSRSESMNNETGKQLITKRRIFMWKCGSFDYTHGLFRKLFNYFVFYQFCIHSDGASEWASMYMNRTWTNELCQYNRKGLLTI